MYKYYPFVSNVVLTSNVSKIKSMIYTLPQIVQPYSPTSTPPQRQRFVTLFSFFDLLFFVKLIP